jgi:ribosomal protein S21
MAKKAVNVAVRPKGKFDTPQKMIRRFMKKVKKYRILESHRDSLRYEKPSETRSKAKKRRKKVLDKLKAEEKKYMEADFDALPKPAKKRRK